MADQLRLLSNAFQDGERIPARFTCEGDDMSPPMTWDGVPPETRSLVLLCDDPDAPAGTWHHWAMFDISPDTKALDGGHPTEARTDRARQAVNDFGNTGYGGPCPPPGHGVHHYNFRLLALSTDRLDVGDQPKCAEVEQAAQPHVIAEARLIGTYDR
jgi:Raf kinase inhibitor-like YbhB/YbcL family protein